MVYPVFYKLQNLKIDILDLFWIWQTCERESEKEVTPPKTKIRPN